MDHADRMGFYLHFKMQEAVNDKLLDGGDVGVERKLYYGGGLQVGSKDTMTGGIGNSMGLPPSDLEKDWVVLVRKK